MKKTGQSEDITTFRHGVKLITKNDICVGSAKKDNSDLYERETVNTLIEVLQNYRPIKLGDLFIDVGAYTGYYSVLMHKLFPQIEVLCVEPNPIVYGRLIQNIELNNLEEHIISYNIGSGENSALTKFYMKENTPLTSGGSFVESVNHAYRTLEYDIITEPLTLTLAHYKAIFQIDTVNVRLIKIDVEEFELSVLKGARRILNAHKPVLLIETLPGRQSTLDTVDYLVNECGYTQRFQNLDGRNSIFTY